MHPANQSIMKHLHNISSDLGAMEAEFEEQRRELQHWKRQAEDRVSRKYHRRECVAACMLGVVVGIFVALVSVGIVNMWLV